MKNRWLSATLDSPDYPPLFRHFWMLGGHSGQEAGGASAFSAADADKVPWSHNIARCLCRNLMGHHCVLPDLLKDLWSPSVKLCKLFWIYSMKERKKKGGEKGKIMHIYFYCKTLGAAVLVPWPVWHLGSTRPFAPCSPPALHRGCQDAALASPPAWTPSRCQATPYSGLCLHLPGSI